MGKASRRKKVTDPAKLKAYRPPIPFVARPYEGLPKEIELVAMRELIPAATLTARTDADHGAVEFDFVTLLPEGASASDVAPGTQALAKALEEALTVTERLDDKERRARQGLVSRAVTIR